MFGLSSPRLPMGLWSGRSVAVTSSYPFSQHKHDRLTNVKENLARRRMKHRVVMRALVAEAESEKRRRPPAVPRVSPVSHTRDSMPCSRTSSTGHKAGLAGSWVIRQREPERERCRCEGTDVAGAATTCHGFSSLDPSNFARTPTTIVRDRTCGRARETVEPGELAASGCPQRCMPGRGRASVIPAGRGRPDRRFSRAGFVILRISAAVAS